jgi:hypothetical protein
MEISERKTGCEVPQLTSLSSIVVYNKEVLGP